MRKSIYLSFALILIGGLAAFHGWQTAEDQSVVKPSALHDIVEAAKKQPYCTGTATVRGKKYEFQYKRYDVPIVITSEFQWEESARISPLDTFLSILSATMRSAPLDDYLSLMTDADTLMINRILPIVMEAEIAPDNYTALIKNHFVEHLKKAIVLGDILHRDITIIVIQYAEEDMYEGLSVVSTGSTFLGWYGAKDNDLFLRGLSEDNYSVVTGYKEEDD